jgi:chemotaxis signal transduction protein
MAELNVSESATRALLPLQVQSAWVMVEAASVREILGAEPWVPIPHTRAEVPGVLAWRGRAIAVVDLAFFFDGIRPLAVHEVRERAVIAQAGDNVFALPADVVREVQDFPRESLRIPHTTAGRFTTFEVDFKQGIAPVVDLAAVIQSLLPSDTATGHA